MLRCMAARRTYFDGCAAAHALDLVGERWALLVVRELVLGPKRFTDLRAGLPQLSPNVLAQRLRELEESGIVRRRRLPPPAASAVYELSEWGLELEAVLQALGRWGARSPVMPEADHMGVDSLVLALRTMYAPAAVPDATLELQLGEQAFHAVLAAGELTVGRGPADGPDAVLAGEPAVLASVIFGGRALADAVASGELDAKGDADVAARFLALFPLPPKASPA